jgi:hypothetical protein
MVHGLDQRRNFAKPLISWRFLRAWPRMMAWLQGTGVMPMGLL